MAALSSPCQSPQNPQHGQQQQELHPIVGDRIISGLGTSREQWQDWAGLQQLAPLALDQLQPQQRVCIFAPHPDDEILGCAGLIQQLSARGHDILIVHITDGTGSHPGSSLYPPARLGEVRLLESQAAIEQLQLSRTIQHIRFGLTDGHVPVQRAQLSEQLQRLQQPGDLWIAPFALDGHPDHEIGGQVIANTAHQLHLTCWQVLIWAWHWAVPADHRIDWNRVRRLDLTEPQLAAKRQAIDCFESQIQPDPSTGQPPIVSEPSIERLLQPLELYWVDEPSPP